MVFGKSVEIKLLKILKIQINTQLKNFIHLSTTNYALIDKYFYLDEKPQSEHLYYIVDTYPWTRLIEDYF